MRPGMREENVNAAAHLHDAVKDMSGREVEKAGREWVMVCPFHDDRNPSMRINDSKLIWKCFACQAGGRGIVSFTAKLMSIGRDEAMKMCEEYYGLTGRRIDSKKLVSVIRRRAGREIERRVMGERRMKKCYEDDILKLMRSYRRKTKDMFGTADGYVEWIWEEFDREVFVSRSNFDRFREWAKMMLVSVEKKIVKRILEFRSEVLT